MLVVAHKEASLVLQVEMGGETISVYLRDDFLLEFVIENTTPFIV